MYRRRGLGDEWPASDGGFTWGSIFGPSPTVTTSLPDVYPPPGPAPAPSYGGNIDWGSVSKGLTTAIQGLFRRTGTAGQVTLPAVSAPRPAALGAQGTIFGLPSTYVLLGGAALAAMIFMSKR